MPSSWCHLLLEGTECPSSWASTSHFQIGLSLHRQCLWRGCKRSYGGRGRLSKISRVLCWDGNSTGLPVQCCFIGTYGVRLPFAITPFSAAADSLTDSCHSPSKKRSYVVSCKLFLKPVARSLGAAASEANFAVISGIFYLQDLYLTNRLAPDILFYICI